MVNSVFLIVGVILIGSGVLAYFANYHVRSSFAMDPAIAKYIMGGVVGGLGVIFTLAGLVGKVRGSQQAKRKLYIMQNGANAEGTVTFVDKNYSILVNKTPIFSIVEYTYKDQSGNPHTRRIDDINSEIVIRKQIQVGAKIPIKYLAQSPGESVIVLEQN